jgi:hypothetical protein
MSSRWTRVALAAFLVCAAFAAVPVTMSSFSGQATNPTSNFSAAASFCSSPSVVWMSGFEAGAVSSAGLLAGSSIGAGSSASADATVARSGNYAMKLVKASGAGAYVSPYKANGAGVVVLRMSLRFNSLPSSDGEIFRFLTAAGNGAYFRVQTSGNINVDFNGTGTAASYSALSAGRWYRIDARITVNTNPRTIDWRVNGVAQSQAFSNETASTVNGNLDLGAPTTTAAYTGWFDDVAFSTTSADYPLPDGHIESVVPDAVSAVNDPATGKVQDDSGTAVAVATPGAASRLSDQPMTSITSFVKHVGTNNASYAQTSFADTNRSGCIDTVNAVVAYHASTATGGIGATYIYDGATQRTVQASGSITNTAIAYKAAMISPATGTWDATKLNGLVARVGHSSTATTTNYPAWDALRLEFDVIPNASTAYENTVLADSPSGYWRLGDTSGTTAAAKSGAVTGTYTNGPLLGIGGAVGDADTSVTFDGSNDYVSFGDNFDQTGTTSFSVECWVYPTAAATANYPVLVGKYTGTAGWNLYLESSAELIPNAVTFERAASGSDYAGSQNTSTALQLGRWYHVVATYDGSTMKVYLNGVLQESIASSRSLANTAQAMTVGGTGDPFAGRIDEVAIYGTALSLTRVQAHYNAGKP